MGMSESAPPFDRPEVTSAIASFVSCEGDRAEKRIFRLVPGLENAEFLRTGSIHRNTYLNFPQRLTYYGAAHARPDIGSARPDMASPPSGFERPDPRGGRPGEQATTVARPAATPVS